MKYKLLILFSIISYLCHGQKIKLELNLTPGKSYTQCVMVYTSAKQPQNDPKKSDSTQHQDTESYSRIKWCQAPFFSLNINGFKTHFSMHYFSEL